MTQDDLYDTLYELAKSYVKEPGYDKNERAIECLEVMLSWMARYIVCNSFDMRTAVEGKTICMDRFAAYFEQAAHTWTRQTVN